MKQSKNEFTAPHAPNFSLFQGIAIVVVALIPLASSSFVWLGNAATCLIAGFTLLLLGFVSLYLTKVNYDLKGSQFVGVSSFAFILSGLGALSFTQNAQESLNPSTQTMLHWIVVLVIIGCIKIPQIKVKTASIYGVLNIANIAIITNVTALIYICGWSKHSESIIVVSVLSFIWTTLLAKSSFKNASKLSKYALRVTRFLFLMSKSIALFLTKQILVVLMFAVSLIVTLVLWTLLGKLLISIYPLLPQKALGHVLSYMMVHDFLTTAIVIVVGIKISMSLFSLFLKKSAVEDSNLSMYSKIFTALNAISQSTFPSIAWKSTIVFLTSIPAPIWVFIFPILGFGLSMWYQNALAEKLHHSISLVKTAWETMKYNWKMSIHNSYFTKRRIAKQIDELKEIPSEFIPEKSKKEDDSVSKKPSFLSKITTFFKNLIPN